MHQTTVTPTAGHTAIDCAPHTMTMIAAAAQSKNSKIPNNEK